MLKENLKYIGLCGLFILLAIAAPRAQTIEMVVQQNIPHSDTMIFSADGKLFAGGGWGKNVVVVWDTASGRELRRFSAKGGGGQDGFMSLAFSPDGEQIAAMSNVLEIWNLLTGEEVKQNDRVCFSGEGSALRIHFSPDGKKIEIPCSEKIQVLDLQTNQIIKTYPMPISNQALSEVYSFDKKFLARLDETGKLLIETIKPKKRIFQVDGVKGKLVALSSNGRTFAVSTEDEEAGYDQNFDIEFRDAAANGAISGQIKSAGFVPESSFYNKHGFYTLETGNDKLSVRDEASGKKYIFESAAALALSPVEKKVAVWRNGLLSTAELETGKILKTFGKSVSDQEPKIPKLTFSPGGRFVVKTSDALVEIWDSQSDAQTPFFQTSVFYEDDVQVVAFSPDEKIFFVNENKPRKVFTPGGSIYETAAKKLIKHFKVGIDESELIGAAAISPNRELIAIAGRDAYSADNKSVKIWSRSSGTVLHKLIGHELEVRVVKFTPKGDYLLTGGEDKTVRMWDVPTGRQVRIFTGHTESISDIEISPDGQRFLSADADGIKRIWDIKSGKEIVKLAESPGGGWVRIAPDGRFEATDNTLKDLHYVLGLKVINLEQFKQMYYEPNLLAKLLGLVKEPLRPVVPLKHIKSIRNNPVQ